MRPLDRRVLAHLRVARLPLAAVVGAGVVGAVLVVAQALAVAALVAGLLTGGSWQPAALAVAVVTVLRAVTAVVSDRAATHAALRVGAHLRRLVLDRTTGPGGGRGAATGATASLVTRGVTATEPYLTRYVPALLLAGLLPPLVVVTMLVLDPWAALVVVATLPLVPVFAALVGLATRDRAEQQWRLLGSLAGHFVDLVRGLPTLVAHRRAGAQVDRVREVTDRYRRANRDVLRLAFASSAVLELVATMSVALVAVLVGLRLAAGGLDLQTALALLLLAPEAYWPLRRVGAEFHAAAEGVAAFDAVEALERPAPVAVTPAASVRLVGGAVTWPGRDRPALGPLDLDLPEAGLVVVRGPSGCGKSTLLGVLSGDVALTGGRLEVPAGDVTAWRRQVAHLDQRPWLLAGSVADNVRVGRPAATNAEVRRALADVGLDLDPTAVLDEDGHGLSAGQRARVGLARVLVSGRPTVLLDEPTAHLDADATATVVRRVVDLARTRRVVAVAHDGALAAVADAVVDLPAPQPAVTRPASPGRPDPVRVLRGREAEPTSRRDDRARLALATALGTLATASGVALTATAGWLIARSAEQPPVLTLLVAVVGVRLFGLARPVLRWAERLVSHDVALRRLAERRTEVYAALVPLVPGAIGRRRGDLLASLVDDVDAVADETLRVRMPRWVAAGTGALLVGATVVVAPTVAVLLAGLLVASAAGAHLLARGGARRHAATRVGARAALSAQVVELLTEARPRALWGADEPAREALRRTARDLDRATSRTERWRSLGRAWPVLVTGVGVAAVAAAVAPGVTAGTLSGPVAALLVLVPLALVDVVQPLADAGTLSVETRAARDRLDALLRRTPTVREPALTLPGRAERGRGDVRLDRVAAGWDGPDVVRDVSLAVRPGRAVALRGPSGCGKSTVAAVLVRFLDPSGGRYRLDGDDVRRLPLDAVRGQVGLLDDHPHVFASTLAENVRLARPDADDADVEHALRRARLGGWLDGLPAGLATRLGDGAAEVSGGERVRLGLARLLLAGPPVLVLDEPTAHLDPDTAHDVERQLLALRDEHALVWITHRPLPDGAVDDVLDLGPQRLGAAG